MRFLLILLALTAAAQTRPHTSQVRGTAVTQPQLVGLVGGRLVNVTLGPGVQMVQVSGGWEIRVASAQVVEARLTRAQDGGWPLPTGCAVRAVFRNGLRQVQGLDWAVANNVLRFTDGTSDPSMPDDTIIVECGQ